MNRGDTNYFGFKIKKGDVYIDGSVFNEIEVQFNKQHNFNSIKKLKTRNEVEWKDNHFICFLSQQDTFVLSSGECDIQVRLMINHQVISTKIATKNIGVALSSEVLDG